MTSLAFLPLTSLPLPPERAHRQPRHRLPRFPHTATKPTPQTRPPMQAATMSTATPENAPATPHHHDTARDWRTFRAHLLQTETHRARKPRTHSPTSTHWAHHIAHLEVGCILLTPASHHWPPAFAHLHRAVILITDVTDVGISGLLLTRATRFTVASHRSVLARVGAEFRHNPVGLGGDCATGTLEMLHDVPPSVCAGASEVVPGVYRGGFNAARSLVKTGSVDAAHFQFFVGYSRWTLEQFAAEMDAGAWMMAACSPSLILSGIENGSLWSRINRALRVVK